MFRKLIDTICRDKENFFNADEIVKLIEESAFNSQEIFMPEKPDEMPNRVLTFRGMCFSLNMLNFSSIFNEKVISKDFLSYTNNRSSEWSIEHGYFSTNVSYPSRFGAKIIIVFKKSDAENSFPHNFIHVIFHSPNEIPTLSHKVHLVEYGNPANFELKIKSFRSDDNMRNVPIEWRKCYFDGEKKLKFFETYTKFHCEIECQANTTLEKCKCVNFWMPREPSTKICNWLLTNCSIGILYEDPCICYPPCNDIKYTYELNRMSIMMVGTKFNQKGY